MPAPKLTADQLKRLARRLINRAGVTIPPALIQQIVSNPPLLRALIEEMGMLIGAAAHRDVIVTLLKAGRADLANVVAYQTAAKRGGDGPPLPSKTGMRMREDLGQLPQFAKFTDDAWVHLGNHVKKYGDTRIVFTGALQTLLAHAYRRGKALPMTEDYGKRWMPKDSYAMKVQYADRYLDWLDDAGIVEKTEMPAREVLKVNHTKKDKAVAKDTPDMPVTVYVAGETLPGIIALLGRYGARLGAVATAAAAPELVPLRDAERLPVGSIVVPWVNGRPDTSAFLVVVKGGALPRAVLPQTARSGAVEEGTPLASWGAKEWAVIKKGTGKVPTKSTVDRAVMTWWRGLTASVATAASEQLQQYQTQLHLGALKPYRRLGGTKPGWDGFQIDQPLALKRVAEKMQSLGLETKKSGPDVLLVKRPTAAVTAGKDWVKKDATDRQAQAGIYYSTMNGEFLVIVGPVNPRYKVRPVELYQVLPNEPEKFLGYVAPDKMRNIPRDRALDAGKGMQLLKQKNLDPLDPVAKPLTPSQQEKVRQRIRKKAKACISMIVFFSSTDRWLEADERSYPNNTLILRHRSDGMWLARYKQSHGTTSTGHYVKGPLEAALIALSKAVPDGPCTSK